MNISVQNLGKRYNREWIFRGMDKNFMQGKSYAITGANGSGKSTLLQVLAGAVMGSEGMIIYSADDRGQITDDRRKEKVDSGQLTVDRKTNVHQSTISAENSYRRISIAAPYLDLIEEMTAAEFLKFHADFKPLKKSIPEILSAVGLANAADKQIRYFSSGMKQRLKLAQAFFSDTSVLFLDEPVTNLDEQGIGVYQQLRKNYSADRLVIISSNDPQEYENCDEVIRIADYKLMPA